MPEALVRVIEAWGRAVGLPAEVVPPPARLRQELGEERGYRVGGPGVPRSALRRWERGHGFRLPPGLRSLLMLADGIATPDGPLLHPLRAIGPMVPFARVPELVVQPESWFEIGNPGQETICIDLAYTWPGGDCPIFTSGDDAHASAPRLIAPGFVAWIARFLQEGGRPYWFDREFRSMGDPWREHRERVPVPPLPARLRPLAGRVRGLMAGSEPDERRIASELGISRHDVEILFRHLQHGWEPSRL
jgi:hypothetical protein